MKLGGSSSSNKAGEQHKQSPSQDVTITLANSSHPPL